MNLEVTDIEAVCVHMVPLSSKDRVTKYHNAFRRRSGDAGVDSSNRPGSRSAPLECKGLKLLMQYLIYIRTLLFIRSFFLFNKYNRRNQIWLIWFKVAHRKVIYTFFFFTWKHQLAMKTLRVLEPSLKYNLKGKIEKPRIILLE